MLKCKANKFGCSVNLLHIFRIPFLKNIFGGLLLFSSLLGKLTEKFFSSWGVFNNFAWIKLRRWLMLKNFAGLTLHEFCEKTRNCEIFYPRKLYYIKLSFFIVNIVNNLPAGRSVSYTANSFNGALYKEQLYHLPLIFK